MIRYLIILTLAIFVAVLVVMTAVEAKTITVGERLGGYVHLHLRVADRWLSARTCVRVRGDQWSAAAIQLRYFKRKGGCVCKTSNIYFHDHAGAGWKSYPAPIKRCKVWKSEFGIARISV